MALSLQVEEHSVPELHLADDLRHAVERCQLHVLYQPIIDLASGQVRGVEALVRWEREPGTLLAPAEFMAVANRTGLIKPIGAWALSRACRDVAAWNRERPDAQLQVAVNLSIRQLADEDIVDDVADALVDAGLAPERLTLEISEPAVIDGGDVPAVLAEFKRLGVRLAIDDFGTGSSSLVLLQHLPADELKIDQSFIAKMDERDNDAVFVRCIVYLARSLGLTTVAEGVERISQQDMLLGLRCDRVQGWLYAKAGASLSEVVETATAGARRARAATTTSTGTLWEGSSRSSAANLMRSAFNFAPIGMAVIDGAGTHLTVNATLCALLGRGPEELVGRSCWEAVHPDDVARDQASMNALLRGEIDSYDMEERYVDAFGDEHWVEVTVGGAPADEGDSAVPVRLLRQVRSIEDRRRASQRAALLSAVVEAATDAIVVTTPEGEITHWNAAAERLYGSPAAEVIGTIYDGAPGVGPSERGEGRDVDSTLETADGRRVAVDVARYQVMGSDGEPTAAVTVLRDMTEVRAASDALARANASLTARAEELAASNDRLSQFAHSLSHDLVQPLAALDGFLTLLRDFVAPQLDEDAQSWLEAAGRSHTRLMTAVEGLLRSAVDDTVSPVAVDLAPIVHRAVADLQPRLDAAGAAVRVEDLPRVSGDPAMLAQVFSSVLDNAYSYRHLERPLRIVIDAAPAAGGRWDIRITDNGIGIDPSDRERIFDHRQRGRNTVDRPGSGIGLSNVRKMITRMGGAVWADSSTGPGTRICLQLPAAAS